MHTYAHTRTHAQTRAHTRTHTHTRQFGPSILFVLISCELLFVFVLASSLKPVIKEITNFSTLLKAVSSLHLPLSLRRSGRSKVTSFCIKPSVSSSEQKERKAVGRLLGKLTITVLPHNTCLLLPSLETDLSMQRHITAPPPSSSKTGFTSCSFLDNYVKNNNITQK